MLSTGQPPDQVQARGRPSGYCLDPGSHGKLDAVVVRHGAVGAADYLARKLRRSVVFNGGDVKYTPIRPRPFSIFTQHGRDWEISMAANWP